MQVVKLCGDWQVAQVGRGKRTLTQAIPAVVPGCIHMDLLAASAIDDPYYRDNERGMAWIGWSDWQYSRSFDVPAELLQRDCVLLRCEGLDTLAEVRINGRLVATTDNMFRTWEFDARPSLRPGRNEIAIRFASVLGELCRRDASLVKLMEQNRRDYKIPGGEMVRKSPCNFGWDWGPKLVTCGIWRAISLVGFDTARIVGVQVLQHHRDERVSLTVQAAAEMADGGAMAAYGHAEGGETSATGNPVARGGTRSRLRAEVSISLAGKTVAGGVATLRSGKASVELEVPRPKLWWPAGMGEQPMYDVSVRLLDASGGELDAQTRRVGLRTIELIRSKDEHGESFYFRANGKAVFAKGANWIPADTFAPAVTAEHCRRLLSAAAAGNMNMIRIWGGGYYEDDAFYDCCDELGLLVWQDFMFANARYPLAEPAFRANVAAELTDNIRRLRHHPCLALWCGNNEIELVARRWDPSYWPEHWKFFKGLLAMVVHREDPQRPYWPGSPHGGEYNDPNQGDAHTWDVWHGRQPFEWYRGAMHRFCSEFGFQSFPEPRTVEGYTLPGDRNITSPIMELHQKNNAGNGLIMHYMLSWFRVPRDFDSMLWASQILQALAIESAVEHWRRNTPRCMGALYWQLNDCWPVASWSSIDYHGRWKALHYAARRFFAPLLLSAVEDAETHSVELHLSSDAGSRRSGTIRWTVVTLDGRQVQSGSRRVAIAAADGPQSTRVCQVNLAGAVKEVGEENIMLFAELTAGGQVASRTTAALVKPKQMDLGRPRIAVDVAPAGDGFEVTLTSDRPALWVWLEVAGSDAKLSDNFFHLEPGRSMIVTVRPAAKMTAPQFKRALHVRSLADLH